MSRRIRGLTFSDGNATVEYTVSLGRGLHEVKADAEDVLPAWAIPPFSSQLMETWNTLKEAERRNDFFKIMKERGNMKVLLDQIPAKGGQRVELTDEILTSAAEINGRNQLAKDILEKVYDAMERVHEFPADNLPVYAVIGSISNALNQYYQPSSASSEASPSSDVSETLEEEASPSFMDKVKTKIGDLADKVGSKLVPEFVKKQEPPPVVYGGLGDGGLGHYDEPSDDFFLPAADDQFGALVPYSRPSSAQRPQSALLPTTLKRRRTENQRRSWVLRL